MDDYSDKFNTELSPEEEARFLEWAQRSGRQKDSFDYDVRGWWKSLGGATDARGHGTDQFKKPNHPTFSKESQYSTPEAPGGAWDRTPDGRDRYTPSPDVLNRWGTLELQRYFNRVEPRALLNLPKGKP